MYEKRPILKSLSFAVLLMLVLGFEQRVRFGQTSVSIGLDPVVNGLSNPVYITHAGDGSGRLFIVEQAGRILIFQNGSLLTVPFLDIRGRVASGGEKGLLSVAFHPDYVTNRRFFINYTANRPDLKTIVAEYQTRADNPNVADPNERVVLQIDQPFENHNGGQLQFGPDGYLYIGMGDGGSGGDPQGNGQNQGSLLGKLLRIDIDHGSPFAVPPDNPLLRDSDADEIWAYGFRNPWRFSFDRVNGRLFLADVGQSSFEEVDIVDRGGNYGWNIMEGAHCFSPPAGCISTGMELPINEYDHSLGNSVTGGYVYRGKKYPALAGTYLFGDFGSSRIWGLAETNRETWIRTELFRPGFNISSFGEDESGEIYVVDYGGTIYRIRVMNSQVGNGPQELIPSSIRSDDFTSLLSVINRDSESNSVSVTARREDGSVSGTLRIAIGPGGFFRSSDILGSLNLPNGSFGPITVQSSNGKALSTVSEVRSLAGAAGFFAGQSVARASNERIIVEVADTGERGTPGTFRTNLGINNLGLSIATVRASLFTSSGVILGVQEVLVPPGGMVQVNNIVQSLLGATSTTGVSGYLRLISDQPIHAWASKIDNVTEDPSLETGVGEELSETGTKLLIPSVSNTDRFKSLLVVVNREDESNEIAITALGVSGDVIATLRKTLPARGSYRSSDILGQMGQPTGSFGPLILESRNRKLLSAISEVRSAEGTAGFFPAVNPADATLQRVVAEVVDSGDRGNPGTFRTNLGVNNLGPGTARVTLQLIAESGSLLGSQTLSVPPNGMKQINNVVRYIREVASATGIKAYLNLISDQPLHGWASKINNETDDPSIVMATP
jgi:glucose/arabinose dehydrogenase